MNIILKFGGTSVGTAQRIKDVIEIVSRAKKNSLNISVVVSAYTGVTDSLIRLSQLAAKGDQCFRQELAVLHQRHIDVIKKLLPATQHESALLQTQTWANELSDSLQGVFLVKECSKRTQDYIVSFGERFSAHSTAQALLAHGISAEFLDARKIIVTDKNFGAAKVDFNASNAKIKEFFSDPKPLQIITGFIAASVDGQTTTLGRGGSDYTAAIIGAALAVKEIQIWTDVDGMLTADPRKVPKAFPLPQVTYEEAMELCHFGAKVIHPPTLQPAFDRKIPIRICNTFNPNYPGTIISESASGHSFPLTGISSISKIALLRLQGSGMVGVAGVSRRLFGILADQGINVILITQASSEHTICFAIEPDRAADARRAIEGEFNLEIAAKIVDPLIVEDTLSIVSVVGENMRNTPGIAGKIFSALGKNGVNVAAIAQGSSELNISIVVNNADEAKALNAIHDEFFLSGTKTLNLFMVGAGQIGKTLLAQIHKQLSFLKEELALEICLVAIANSKKMLIRREGLPLNNWQQLLEERGEPSNFAQLLKEMRALNLPNSVFIDCTANEELIRHYAEILDSSIPIVTPNKKAQSADYAYYSKIKATSKKRGVPIFYETSVGAGLPVINTLNDLLRSGDTIEKIEAVLSGTLSFIFNSFTSDSSFSEIVKQAKKLGYTEPDPRDDLSGLDVARKILILGREAGLKLELKDVQIEQLLPPKCLAAKSIEDFFMVLKEYDSLFAEKIVAATKAGKKLRYIARLENNQAQIMLTAVDSRHPFYNLSGSDNIISFTTTRYHDRPLVVKGPGAGAEVTAAGVFADLIRVARL